MYPTSSPVVQVERGIATKGAEVEVVGLGNTFKTTLTGIGTINTNASLNFSHEFAEMFHKELDRVSNILSCAARHVYAHPFSG